MSDCTSLDMRDLLPDFARGALSGDTVAAVEGHVAACASCRAELAVLRTARAALNPAPPVDTARIVAAVARSNALRRDAATAVARVRRRRSAIPGTPARRAWLAAASVVAIVSATVLASRGDRGSESPTVAPVVASEPAGRAPVSPAPGVELMMGGGVSDLADADLESLLDVLDDVDTELDVEPAVLLPVLEGDV